MLKELSSKFDPMGYSVKALLAEDNETIVTGWLSMRNGNVPFVTEDGEQFWKVNPYGICVNTRIPVGDTYLYEFDLVEYKEPLSSGIQMGYITFDLFSNSWVIRTSFNFSSISALKKCVDLKIIGNVDLSDTDVERFQKYSDDIEASYHSNPSPECRSTQHLNKLAKQFLPR